MAQGKAASANEPIYQQFNDLINMAPKELEKWLETKDSKSVGFKEKDGANL